MKPWFLFWIAYLCGMIVSSVKVRDFGILTGAVVVCATVLVLASAFFFLLDRYWTCKS